MNMILLFDEDFVGAQEARVRGRRYNHIVETIKPKIGDCLKVGLWNGGIGFGRVEAIDPMEIRFFVKFESSAPAPLNIDLILPLPRPKVLPRIIQTVTNLGVKRVAFVNFWKVDKSYWNSHYLEQDSLNKSIKLGLEQAVDTKPPVFEFFRLFKPFAEDVLDSWCGEKAVKILCHPHVKNSGGGFYLNSSAHKTLAIGPEGGFTPYEVDVLLSRGFVGFSLMERILKLETAIPTLVGRFL